MTELLTAIAMWCGSHHHIHARLDCKAEILKCAIKDGTFTVRTPNYWTCFVDENARRMKQ